MRITDLGGLKSYVKYVATVVEEDDDTRKENADVYLYTLGSPG
jgi:hypothetical protein